MTVASLPARAGVAARTPERYRAFEEKFRLFSFELVEPTVVRSLADRKSVTVVLSYP
jgi:hypothetical protein